jgi:predicted RNA polymerase sigma factor
MALQEPRGQRVPDVDDTLTVLFMCCHSVLTPASAVALTLRAVGGLTTAEIANAFLVDEATMAQRISRAKRQINTSGVPFALPGSAEQPARLRSVLHALYLIFNEGYTTSSGAELHRADLSNEAIRLARLLRRLLPNNPEVTGLLALMLLIDSRRAARADAAGELVPLPDQDRRLWDRASIAEGLALVNEAIGKGTVGEYQLQAAITAVHARAATAPETDWRQILGLYELLEQMTRNPVVTVNRAIAAAMVDGPPAGFAVLDEVDERMNGHYRVDAVRAHLFELAGDADAAIEHYRRAARRTTNLPEQRYLTKQAARLQTCGSAT